LGVRALRDAGIILLALATNPTEAQAVADAGIHAVVAQGYEAGGHSDGTVGRNYTRDTVQIEPRANNSESRGFDTPCPFGPESTQQ